jgi:hypothetical protein
MAEIDDTLSNEVVKDEAFVEQEVEVPNEELETSDNAEITMDEEGGAEINFDPNVKAGLETENHFSNLAEVMDEQYLDELGTTLFDQYTEYKQSRGEWEDSYRELGFNYDDRTEPFKGA